MLEVHKHRVSVDGYKEVTHTVAKYVEAIRIGNVDLLADAFHMNSVTHGFVDGSLNGWLKQSHG